VARAATVHLAPRPGTNVALMNGLLHEIIANDWVDHDYIEAHTVGFEDLARVWNVDPMSIPYMSPPTHVMQMMRYVEDGSIRMPWVSGTNPAVSLPELDRVRSILSRERLFLVVQDIFLDYARRLELKDKDGQPLVKWDDAGPRSRHGRTAPAGGPATTPASPTASCAEAPASSGPATRTIPTARNGATPTGSSGARRATAKATGGTWSPVPRWKHRSTRP
jgi:hypothetical protein